ncbi:hypothetical protein GXM_08027 [Nostoc sphaeroides CCNUC1]|uniref:Uncharacterized protein n=1 Tax=Nostoc sphaeroides CCNUC1 TaxID=2653204 RepID=A0A5P8WCJ5_9NOSO|nr:hypothetical protein GXM_08027 [Nostoc sphaeroides CCNUC1]
MGRECEGSKVHPSVLGLIPGRLLAILHVGAGRTSPESLCLS